MVVQDDIDDTAAAAVVDVLQPHDDTEEEVVDAWIVLF